MSNYIFAPSPTFGISEHPFATWENGFSEEQLEKIISYCNAKELSKAIIGTSSEADDYSKIRESKVAWIQLNQETSYIYDQLAYIARCLNGQFFKFDLYGFDEHLQFTVYDGEVSGHYGWHQDYNVPNVSCPRKLSIVLQLSDPSEYEGGDLEIHAGNNIVQVKKEKGLVTAFPSFMLHRVTPVTKGIRKTLVVWVCGNSFK